MASYIVEKKASYKIILHSMKYPYSECQGILVGQEIPGDQSTERVVVTDSIPVSHSHINLTGPMEVALCLVDSWCQSQGQGMRVVGFYRCNERLDDTDLGPVGRKIADTVAKVGGKGGALVLVLNGKYLIDGSVPFVSYTQSQSKSGQWVVSPNIATIDVDKTRLEEYVGKGLVAALSDFDEHLDSNLEKDWINSSITF